MLALRKKLDGEDGFTLVEMLIVVAIIAILVAVSIPLVNSALERARIATDAANERSARALATVRYLTDDIEKAPNDTGGDSTTHSYLYDAANGVLIYSGGHSLTGTYKPYGQCTTNEHKGKYLLVQVLENGTVRLAWAEGIGGTFGVEWNTNLCTPKVQSGK